MKLQNKLILMILSVFIIALLFMGIIIFSNSKTILEKQVEKQLNSVSEMTENNIENFLDSQKDKIKLIATQSDLTSEELNEMILLDDSFYDLFIIDEKGYVVTSTNIKRIGLYRGNRTYFTMARNQTYISPVYLALVPEVYSLAVSTPFHNGVLVGAIRADILNDFTTNRLGMGETGESLMTFINEDGKVVYFSERRFSNKVLESVNFEEVPLSMKYALNNEEKFIPKIKDYRGKDVISFSRYIENIRVGMVTKIDIEEIFSTVNSLRNLILFLVIIIILIIIFIIYFISKDLTFDITNLANQIKQITQGDLSIHLSKSNINEIKILTDSLNRILASMKLAILRTGISASEIGIGEVVKAKEEAEEKYKTLYESSADAIMILEPSSGKFISGNPATLKIFNLKNQEELKKLSPADVSPLKQPDGSLSSGKAKKMIEKAMKEGKTYFEWTHKRYRGESFPASVLLTRFKLNGKEVIQATVRDLSKKTIPFLKK